MPSNKVNGFEKNGFINGYENTNKLKEQVRTSWNVKASEYSKNTRNRIREVNEQMKVKPNPHKDLIRLTIGDPTTFGNLRSSVESREAIIKSVNSEKFNGYAHLQGLETARKAIAEYSAHQSSKPINPENIFITNGCATALEYCILTLAKAGMNLLVPRPGYTLYETQAENFGIEMRYYNLLPEKNWEADLVQLESLIDENTAALIINNPSNPCGSVFSKEHLEKMVAICERNFLPIIADEIYEKMVFPGQKYVSVSSLTENVPVLTCSGLTKRFLVPGWRTGWLIVHDPANHLGDTIMGLRNMSGRVLGSSCLIQGAIPDILNNTRQSFFDDVMKVIAANAKLAYDMLSKIPGLHPVMSSGAMYMMISIDIERFPEFKNDTQFVESLVNEQSVFCLPGACFVFPNSIRIVVTVPGDLIKEACTRIAEFCKKHYKQDSNLKQKLLSNSVQYDLTHSLAEKQL